MSTLLQAEKPGTPLLQRAVALGAAVHTLRIQRRLNRVEGAEKAQRSVFRDLTRQFAATAFGREAGVEVAMDYTTFQARVAPRTYEWFAPWIERMKRGDADVLWPGRCAYYAVSSGTSAGRTKYLPITREMIAHFRRTGLESLCHYARRAGSARVFQGKHLMLGGSTTLSPLSEGGNFPAWSGDLSGITALNLPGWVERHLYEPGREIAQMADWPAKIRAIAARTVGRNVSLIAGIPSWLLIFAEQMRAQTGRETLQEIWPKLECLIHGGVPLGPFVQPLHEAFGAGVRLHEVYPASEGFIAAQDDEPEAGLRLMADAGIFYEFLPLELYDEARLPQLGREAVPLSGVRTGVDYVLLMTTPAGLCRYVIGDVVRFVSTEPPRLVYAGRTKLQLSAFGEHVIEKEITDALAAVTARRGLTVVNFHVAPRFAEAAEGTSRGCHEWWLEFKGDSGATLEAALLGAELDAELQLRNDDYEAKRKGGGLELPSIRAVPAGTFERWLRSRGKWGGQNKMPRCRSDREIADALEAFRAGP